MATDLAYEDIGWAEFYEDYDSADEDFLDQPSTSRFEEISSQNYRHSFGNEANSNGRPNEKFIEVSLEELLYGCTKVETISRHAYDTDGAAIIEDQTFEIEIKPGASAGMPFPFPKAGDQLSPNEDPFDLVFYLKEKPHDVFTRHGADLHLTAFFPETHDLQQFQIPTLEGYQIPLSISRETILADNIQRIQGYGLPYYNQPDMRGSIIICFQLQQYQSLNMTQIEEDESEYENDEQSDFEDDFDEFDEQNPTYETFTWETLAQKLKSALIKREQIIEDDNEEQQFEQDPPIIQPVQLSLTEILHGCTKELKFERDVVNSEGIVQRESETFSLEINPGTKAETEIKFEKAGHRYPNKHPADIIFVVKDEPHPIFQRKNNVDLLYIANITKRQSLLLDSSYKLQIPTLENDHVPLEINQQVITSTEKEISSLGLPYVDDPNLRGNLLVQFQIVENEIIDCLKVLPQDFPIKHYVEVPLEHIMHGKPFNVKFTRFEFNAFDKPISEKEIEFTLPIKPGTKAGKGFKFAQAGHLRPNRIPADVIFVVRDKPHQYFNRLGKDIEYIAKITPNQANIGSTINIPTLENEEFLLEIDEPISEHTVKRISNRGLPDDLNNTVRGDIVVKFQFVDVPIVDQIIPNLHQQNLPNPPIEHHVELTLSEVFHGCKKETEITRIVVNADTEHEQVETKTLKFTVKPGTESGARFFFPREGNQMLGQAPSDVLIITADKRDEQFVRDGQNIVYTVRLAASSAKTGCEMTIPTIDANSNPKICIKEAITNDTEKCIYGRGLPYPDDVKLRGDLIVKFQIDDELDQPNKTTVAEVKAPPCETTHKIEQNIFVSLKELMIGCVRKKEISIKGIDSLGMETVETKIFEVNIKPGTEAGTPIVFKSTTHEGVEQEIVFVVQDERNSEFIREDSVNIEYHVAVAKEGMEIKVPTLEGNLVPLKITKNMLEEGEHRFYGKGLPYPDDLRMRGDFVVKFEAPNGNTGHLFEATSEAKLSNESVQDEKPNYQDSSLFYTPIDVSVPLEKMVNGGSVKMKVERVIEYKGKEKTIFLPFDIPISAGTQPGQLLTVQREGESKQNVFVVCPKAHKDFQLKMPDIIYTANISLKKALCGFKQQVPTLDDQRLCLDLSNQIVNPDFTKVITDRGLYVSSNSSQRGDLIVNFTIQFPKNLSSRVKTEIRSIFASANCYSVVPETLNKLREIEGSSNEAHSSNGGQGKEVDLQNASHQIPLYLTFEEIVNGCKKTVQLEKVNKKQSKKSTKSNCDHIPITVHPLSGSGIKIHLPITSLANVNSEVVFIVEELPHRYFRKIDPESGNIECNAQITLQDALCGYNMRIITLDAKPLDVIVGATTDQLVSSTFVRCFPDMGLPDSSNTKRGSLTVRFEVIFPEMLNDFQKKSLDKILPNQFFM